MGHSNYHIYMMYIMSITCNRFFRCKKRVYISERLELEDGEITKNGFLQLNDMEAEDSNGDEDDMWVTLESLGINKELVMDEVVWSTQLNDFSAFTHRKSLRISCDDFVLQACPFVIDVYTEDCDDAEFKVDAIEDMMDKLQRPLCQSVMEKVKEK